MRVIIDHVGVLRQCGRQWRPITNPVLLAHAPTLPPATFAFEKSAGRFAVTRAIWGVYFEIHINF